MSAGRKRVVSSCIPCYIRKQKCNREYPCNHCTRRKCPEECAYHSTTTSQTPSLPTPPNFRRDEIHRDRAKKWGNRSMSLQNEWGAHANPATPTASWSGPSLAELFGYFEESDSNTLALIRKLGLASNDSSSPVLTSEAADEVHRNIKRMPDRQILDFLVQYFAAEVSWMDQLVHLPWFLAKYQQWWMVQRVRLVTEVDFAILILRICSYASQFLPSPGYTLDKIRGILLADVRNTCDETADSLATISTAADCRGSSLRVQHLAFHGLRCRIEGNTTAFWEVLSRAVRVAHSVGIYSDGARSRQDVDEVNREMERRTFCNLYIWDNMLSRQLDRIAFIPGCLRPGNWPQLHLLERGCGGEGKCDNIDRTVGAPDPFIERLLQARLADFWRSTGPIQGTEYDMIAAEERYHQFCRNYLSQLPPAFALVDPDETWDKHFTKLPLQRQLLHIAIYESLCWNFRPLLLRRPLPQSHNDQYRAESLSIPTYKRVLLGSQERALAIAALHALDAAARLHALLGGCHTRLAGLIFSTFEAAVLLVYLCMDPLFPRDCHHQNAPPPGAFNIKMNPLHAEVRKFTRDGCIQAVQGALKRLRMLAEVSSMADVGGKTLTRLLNKAIETNMGTRMETETETMSLSHIQECGIATIKTTTRSSQLGATSAAGKVAGWLSYEQADLRSMNDFMPGGDTTSWSSFDLSNMNPQDDFASMSTTQDMQSSWVASIMDLH